jgi:hypothetical protein
VTGTSSPGLSRCGNKNSAGSMSIPLSRADSRIASEEGGVLPTLAHAIPATSASSSRLVTVCGGASSGGPPHDGDEQGPHREGAGACASADVSSSWMQAPVRNDEAGARTWRCLRLPSAVPLVSAKRPVVGSGWRQAGDQTHTPSGGAARGSRWGMQKVTVGSWSCDHRVGLLDEHGQESSGRRQV